jgi:uncharacterized protein YdiU (UPF0061 family)
MLTFDNTYVRELDGLFARQDPVPVVEPRILVANGDLAERLGIDPGWILSDDAARVLGGNARADGSAPIAQAYAGHQFGGFNPQLGDGRAVLLGEIVSPDGKRFDVALKGSGRTPFSRGGDGRAAIGPVLREFLMGEAMHALGVPTTRALASVATGEQVYRDQGPLPGAVLARVAASHLRIGTFQFFAARGDTEKLQRLLDYAIARHDPDLADVEVPALALLDAVIERQASLVATWMTLGFIHGVMNTDNMTISGETIDYGPCAFMETYRPATVFSSIDTGGRYAYGNQPRIAQWNLARLAEALLALVPGTDDERVAAATELLERFPKRYEDQWMAAMRRKLGLGIPADGDLALAADWLELLDAQSVDYTLAFRHLADEPTLRKLFADQTQLDEWLARWHARAGRIDPVNPLLIPRNHHVEAALSAAQTGDLAPFERLLRAVRKPFEADPQYADLAEPAPPGFTDGYRTFCGT